MARVTSEEGEQRAFLQALAQARTISDTAIAPHLTWHDLTRDLNTLERNRLSDSLAPLVRNGTVLRLRLRAADGAVVFDADNPEVPKTAAQKDDEVESAMAGSAVTTRTRLNNDGIDSGPRGEEAIEVYLPISPIGGGKAVGALEVYVPYAPIATAELAAHQRSYLALGAGLGGLWLLLGVITWSMTSRLRRTAEQNEWLALHDPLTGLPNRSAFRDAVAARMAESPAPRLTVIVVDLDGFTRINDTLGHRNGDEFLCHVSRELSASVGDDGVVARLDGDQFGLLVAAGPFADDLLVRLRDGVAREVELDGVPVSCEGTTGVASWPPDADDAGGLIRAAELALHSARANRVQLARFHPGLDRFDPARLSLVAELRRALLNGELVLHYQPKIALASGEIMGVEALVRWQHPTRGLLPPNDFIPVAESTGLIAPLTSFVIDEALRQIAEWTDAGIVLTVAVNVSPRSLRDESLPDEIARTLARRGIAAQRLEIEITETAALVDPARSTAILRRLHDGGIGISLDDFGQGATSLAYLGRLPLDELKVDRAFVDGMTTCAEDRTIVRSVIELGHQLGLRVIAEGVETADHLEMLRELNCDAVQGYLYTRPLPPEAFVEWLSRRRVSMALNGGRHR